MENKNVCPWWMGYLLLIPFRKITHDPKKIIDCYVRPGMKVIDYGSAMGYFSLPMARQVGDTGKVFCFDIQPKMIEKLRKRAKKAKLDDRIETRLITGNKSDFDEMGQVADFALLFAVAHEVDDQQKLFINIFRMLKTGAHLYFAEPKGHVNINDFERSVNLAEETGFKKVSETNKKNLIAVFQKN